MIALKSRRPSADPEAPDATPSLQVRAIVSGYGGTRIVRGVSLEVPHGSITLLIGRNGSGKSTLLKSMFGLVRVFEGSVVLDGSEITDVPISDRILRGIRYVPQNGGVFGSLSVEENLHLAAEATGTRKRTALESALELFPALHGIRGKRAGELSGGQQRLLAFAMGTMTAPSFLLVDEPSAGLSPLLRHQVLDHLRQIRDQRGTGILLVEQNVKEGCAIADHVYLLRDGRMFWEGTPSSLLDQASLAAFL
jgi:branched-chain amino acid transport system ATP-binding protein